MHISDLTDEELLQTIETGSFPEGTTLQGIEEMESFDLLFKHRNSPAQMAKLILRGRAKGVLKQPSSLAMRRMEMKEKELLLREKSLTTRSSVTHQLELINAKLNRILFILGEGKDANT